MKKFLIGLICGLGLIGTIVYAQTAPTSPNYFRKIGNIISVLQSNWGFQVPSQAGSGGCAYFDASGNILGGAGCSGGGGGGVATSSPYSSSTVPQITNTGALTNSPITIKGSNVGIGATNPILGLLQVGNGTADTRISSFGNTPYGFRATNGGGNGDFYFGATAEANPSGVFSNNAGTELMRIQSNGNVGIGTTNPIQKLAISQDNTSGQQMAIEGSTNVNQQLLIGYSTSGDYGTIQAIKQGSAFEPLALNAYGGNVGIGTTTPDQKLTVYGSGAMIHLRSSDNAYLQVDRNSTSNDGSIWFQDNGASKWLMGQNGATSGAGNNFGIAYNNGSWNNAITVLSTTANAPRISTN